MTPSASANAASTPPPQRPSTLSRSITPSQTPSPTSRLRNIPLPNRLVKSTSTSQIKDKAAEQQQQQQQQQQRQASGIARLATAIVSPAPTTRLPEDHVMDTRTPSPAHSSADGEQSAYKPDLSKEVAMLSTKLINAINYQTNLDDSLQVARHELEQAQTELKRVLAEKKILDDDVTQGVLVKKSEVDVTIAELRAELAQEREKRETAEKAKRQTDGELENLTSSLFEEANKMVAEARMDTEAVERRNSQLRGRLTDTETLLASQQEQLQDLKQTMEALERTATNARDSSIPSTPVNLNSGTFEALQLSPGTAEPADIPPNHPLHFSQLLQPVLRTDVAAYTEFADLLASARKGAPHSRNASGNLPPNLSQTNLASISNSNTSTAASDTHPRTASPSLPGAFSPTPSSSTSAPALQNTKFYKRIQTEDLDPTLRLDLAPGLSFLSRRSVQSALLAGTLIVEPFAPSSTWKLYAPVFACALCGEARKGEPYTRRHRFRTSEAEEAQRYPVCDFCVARVRASGDFVGFLRMVREGVWRCGSEEEEKGAWEEAIRLRERMFWARVGGGVVPASSGLSGGGVRGSPVKVVQGRGSDEEVDERVSASRRSTAKGEDVFGPRSSGSGDAGAGSDPAATTAPAAVDGNEAREASAKELKRRTMLHMGGASADGGSLSPERTKSEDPPSVLHHDSETEQQDSSDQLQREAEAATAEKTTRTPSTDSSQLDSMVSAEEEAPTSSSPPPPVPPHREGVSTDNVSTAAVEPTATVTAQGEGDAKNRSGSDASTTSQQGLNASAAGTETAASGRRPSSVLARVRAMESRGMTIGGRS